VASGGLGIRSVGLLAPSAFLASAASTLVLQTRLLPAGFTSVDQHVVATKNIWLERYHGILPDDSASGNQKTWDEACVLSGMALLQSKLTEPHQQARLLACQSKHSGDWLHAWPISACGLRLDDEAVRVAVGLRLGLDICAPHPCPCGAVVEATGRHGLSCRRSQGRMTRHSQLNEVIHRALTRALVPAVREPVGLLRDDNKRPDGCTLVPWQGRCITWDVTVPDTFAASHLPFTSFEQGAAAERASASKRLKYSQLLQTYDFVPIACETMGPINSEGQQFLNELGHRMTKISGDPRECTFLYQRISVIIQRCNAIAFRGSFCDNIILSTD
jgi:hypothetical protein